MKNLTLTIFLIFCAVPPLLAQNYTVEDLEFGTSVENREIVGADSTFTGTVGQVYCLTRITGMQQESNVTHVWYYNGEEMARVELPVRGTNWRTWSSKSILPGWTGEWSVDIVGPDGDILSSGMFTVTESGP